MKNPQTLKAVVEKYLAGAGLGGLCEGWDSTELRQLVETAQEMQAPREEVVHLRRFLLLEEERPVYTSATARRLSRAESELLGPEDTEEHAED